MNPTALLHLALAAASRRDYGEAMDLYKLAATIATAYSIQDYAEGSLKSGTCWALAAASALDCAAKCKTLAERRAQAQELN